MKFSNHITNLGKKSLDEVLNRMGFPLNWNDIAKIERSRDINEKNYLRKTCARQNSRNH